MIIPFSSPDQLLGLSCFYCSRCQSHPGRTDACDHFRSGIDSEIRSPASVGPVVPAGLKPARVLKLDLVPVAAEARYKDLGPGCFAVDRLALRADRTMALAVVPAEAFAY